MTANSLSLQESTTAEKDFFLVRFVPILIAVYQATVAIVLIAVVLFAFGGLRIPFGLPQITRSNFVSGLIIPLIVGVIFFGCGIWVFLLQQQETTSRIFAIFSTSMALAMAVIFGFQFLNRVNILWFWAVLMAAGSIFHLALVYPNKLFSHWRRLPIFSYGISLVLLLVSVILIYGFGQSALPQILTYTWLGITTLCFIMMAVWRQATTDFTLVRHRVLIVNLWIVLSLIPYLIWIVGLILRNQVSFNPVILFALLAFPLSVAYSFLRFHIPSTEYLLSRAFLYGVLTVIAVTSYALIVSGMGLIFNQVLDVTSPVFIGLMFFLLAILLNPLREYLQKLVDSTFFRGQFAYQERVRLFGQDLTKVLDLKEIGNLLRRHVDETLAPMQMHIFLIDPLREYFNALLDIAGEPTTDLRFAQNSALPTMLSRNPSFVVIGKDGKLPPALESEKARLNILGAHVFVPFIGRERSLIGFMALSDRRSGEQYTSNDLDFLISLSEQTAISIERSQVVADLERSVNEMNVLMRVSEGINITPQFDDILELIYAQTNRLIPLRDFWILLYDQDRDLYRYVFYLEDDIRLLEYENRPIDPTIGLSREVVRSGRMLVTDDYEGECHQRGFEPLIEGLYSWAGVPLNAGAETIGVLSLGSRDASVTFSREQLEMLQAISDQAAGAIVKTRLLQETERRARQLALINEIGRTLTSNLDLPNLLNQVLDNAVEIINCEAGTLFLVDEDTGELIFEVVNGPVADELVGQRLAPGTGHVGHAVNIAKPAIVNQVERTKKWSSEADQSTGFQTRDLLIAPMIVKDIVIGVIEVINRNDGAPFTEDDQDLLTAFASQAGIAVENARLYTLTDQKLAARVDELSVMQRIDRELNASLDIQRAMRITLNWAMKQSGADAGFVGSIDEGFVQIMADRGFNQELDTYPGGQIPVDDLIGLRDAVSQVETQIMHRSSLDSDLDVGQMGILKDMKSQLVYPIRREDQIIGVMLLESAEYAAWAEDIQDFLSRLSDHAAIAISNAQLFAQVRAADTAKNDFISFVAHELKTPMTSIRGYTDLLLGGAMGEISEGQGNFLQTIRGNVTRMATLVSDLADVSRIEAGQLRLEYEAVNVDEIVGEAARVQGHSIDEKGQKIEIQIPSDLPSVWCDSIRLSQILVNLISNANKYSPEGGHITISAQRMDNQWDPGGAAEVVRFAVEDDGLGMTLEDQEQLFSKFFRSSNPEARQAPGSGLGLNITKNLIEMQGGTIWFESVFGEGTTFFFTIPVAQV